MTQNVGPGPKRRRETGSATTLVVATSGRSSGERGYLHSLIGLATVVAIVATVAIAIGLFRGSFTSTVPVTVLSPRVGLVMNPDADVKLHGATVGRVAAIESLPNGQAVHLAMEPSRLHLIPANVLVDITSTTVFGAKFVQLRLPPRPSIQTLQAGQVLQGHNVTVEINTIFQQLTSVLSKIDPAKLNETLGAIASAFDGRGEKIGQTLSNFNAFLADIEPSLGNLEHDIEVAPDVLNAYADAAPDLITIAGAATQISQTIVDEQQKLDEFLVATIGLADIGSDVIGSSRQAVTDVLDLLVPTTDLLNEYHQALNCGIAGMLPIVKAPPLADPGAILSLNFVLGIERYRYPDNLPKVDATGGPHCMALPEIPFQYRAPFLVADVGANPWQYGNQGILLNSDGLKQFLFGPIAGPPRNTEQIGMPG